MEPNGSPLGPEILPKSIKSQTKALEALITKKSQKQVGKVSLQTLPGPLKSSRFLVGCVKNRRSLNQVFLDLRCPSWPPFGSIFSELGHKSSMRTVKKHCGKTPENTEAIISLFYEKRVQMRLFFHRESVFLKPQNNFGKITCFFKMISKWTPNGSQNLMKFIKLLTNSLAL